MPTVSIQDYTDVLIAPAGRRALASQLDEINNAEIVRGHGAHYLHWGIGQYAVVFRCRPPHGQDLALRCLIRPPSQDAAERAEAFRNYLSSLPARPECFVRYHYVPDAILAAQEWRAAYVMDWVSGETLLESARRLVTAHDTNSLSQLSDNLAHTIIQMQAVDVAHGDLHHENILILPEGKIRLVDYDSAYVPPLDGRSCLIVGPEGYAHPVYLVSNTPRPFNAYMDTFAGLILVTSLRAIAHDLTLFQRTTQENLLFRADDLRDPYQSPVFAALLTTGDNRLTALAASLQQMCLDPATAQTPLVRIAGIVQERKKVPGPRIIEPLLPRKPRAWKGRSLIAAQTFGAIFNSEATP